MIKIKISRRSLAALEAAYVVAVAHRGVGGEPIDMLLHEHALAMRDRLSDILERKERKTYSLVLSRVEAAALHFYWAGQSVHDRDAGWAVNAMLYAIDRQRKSPANNKLITEIL